MASRRLSPHFHASEFYSHDGAVLPASHEQELAQLCIRYLEPLRTRFGPVKVHSGHRSARQNQKVGGKPESRHLAVPGERGAAADVSCARGTPQDWHRFLEGLNPGGLGRYSWGVHVDNRPGRARW